MAFPTRSLGTSNRPALKQASRRSTAIINREAIYQALFDRVQSVPGIITASRRGRLAQNVAPEDQPALFQEQVGEVVQYQGEGLPPTYRLNVDLVLYVRVDDPEEPTSGALNPLIDAVAAALEPEPFEETQTLGGLVYHCRISGKLDLIEGVLDGQARAFIPVEILAV